MRLTRLPALWAALNPKQRCINSGSNSAACPGLLKIARMPLTTPSRRLAIATLFIAACAHSAWAEGLKGIKKTAHNANAAAAQGPLYATRPEVMKFADDLAARRDLDAKWVRDAIGQSHYNATVHRLMQPPAKTFQKNWRVYRSRFIDPVRIEAGARFWRTHRETLERSWRPPAPTP